MQLAGASGQGTLANVPMNKSQQLMRGSVGGGEKIGANQ
jgi:hypothetical protein